MSNITTEKIDAILPQTQCGLCGFKGCLPYAEALAHNQAEINQCPPGGVDGLIAIARVVQQDPTPYIQDMQQKSKPKLIAVIREAECIGCTKCIKVCPVDAIIGAGKQMHTVITDECTGCELCIAPCPVDCIDMVASPHQESKADQFRQRYQAREKRLLTEKQDQQKKRLLHQRKAFIQSAILRAKEKKSLKESR